MLSKESLAAIKSRAETAEVDNVEIECMSAAIRRGAYRNMQSRKSIQDISAFNLMLAAKFERRWVLGIGEDKDIGAPKRVVVEGDAEHIFIYIGDVSKPCVST